MTDTPPANLTDELMALLRAPSICYITTLMPDGSPQLTPRTQVPRRPLPLVRRKRPDPRHPHHHRRQAPRDGSVIT